jgi:hypothetical protein
LALPIVALAMLVRLNTVRRLWTTSPYILLLFGVVFGIFAPVGLIAAIVRLWRPRPLHPHPGRKY